MQKNNFEKVKVGRSAIGAVFCALLLMVSIATAINLPETDNEDKSLSYTFLFKEPKSRSTVANNEDYTLIEMDGCYGIGRNAGEPLLPIKSISLLLPPIG